MSGAGEIERLADLQRAENARRATMTPEERAADSRRQLAHIASMEEDHWLAGVFLGCICPPDLQASCSRRETCRERSAG